MFRLFISFLVFSAFMTHAQKLTYPETRKGTDSDNYHGTTVADPYRWLEDDRSAEVEDWVGKQNEVTFGFLDKIPYRKQIGENLRKIYNYPKFSAPFKAGEHLVFSKNDGLQNQYVLYIQKGKEGTPEVLLDPNTWSEDGTVKLSGYWFSNDYRYMAYGISRSGSDWVDFRVMDMNTRTLMKDSLSWIKFSGAQWHGKGFYYSRYDEPKEKDKAYSDINTGHKIYYHALGDDQSKDKLIYQDTSKTKMFFSSWVSDDEKYHFLYKSGEGKGNALYFRNLAKEETDFTPITESHEDQIWPIEIDGDRFILYTTKDAPNGRLVSATTANPQVWKDVVPESKYTIDASSSAGRKIFVTYLKDVVHETKVFDLAGKYLYNLELPGPGTVSVGGGKLTDKDIYYMFSTFSVPPTIYRYDLEKNKSEVFRSPDVGIDFSKYETKQVFYNSKDGTKIPMFILHKKGLKLDGSNQTMLYGYGGFNISLNPWFDPIKIVWLDMGGVYAIANLRGGGEYGEEWHQQGTKLNKQNVFDDFIAAAEYLIKEKYTSAKKLAIIGGSNGGLLVGACMLQRPELFGVAIPEVGVMDMLRYHKFTIGWNWEPDYGTSDDPVQFANLYKYSPVHNVKKGVKYPSTLVTTADHDDRVVPAHSFKFIAELQAKHAGDNPVLIRIDTKSGHGSSSTTKGLERMADIYSFILYTMGVTVNP